MNTRKSYSIDLETLGTDYDSNILSIGCVEFNMETGEQLNKFYRNTSCNDKDFSISKDTVLWWLKQDKPAREALLDDVQDIKHALTDLHLFIDEDSLVWGNGATFDVTILEHAFKVTDMNVPWKFWNIRDMRTLVNVAETLGFIKDRIKRNGTHHNALDDAAYQAKVMSAAYHYIRYGEYTRNGFTMSCDTHKARIVFKEDDSNE